LRDGNPLDIEGEPGAESPPANNPNNPNNPNLPGTNP
jgi:hypothetical protein